MRSPVPNAPDPTARPAAPASESPSRPERLPYACPQLTEYGRIDEITETVGRRGRRDSHGRGGGRNRRTGF